VRTPQERVFVRLPKPSHRHAAPAGPWPYIDTLTDQESEEVIDAKIPAIIGSCGHDDDCQDCKQWIAYPQSLFSIWTIKPVRHSGLDRVIRCGEDSSVIYTVDVLENGVFGDSGTVTVTSRTKRDYWNNTLLPERKPGIRVRAMFVDKMSGPILQMLGTRYIVEPFFFSSSINWIPSRYQENAIPKKGDHITITYLSFVLCKLQHIDTTAHSLKDRQLVPPMDLGTSRILILVPLWYCAQITKSYIWTSSEFT